MIQLAVSLASGFSRDAILTYWNTLAMHDTLKFRIGDVRDPTIEHVKNLMADSSLMMGYMQDDERGEKGEIIGEFTLEGFKGEAARVHFSTHPELTTPERREMIHRTLDILLQCFKGDTPEACVVKTLYGITPVANRVACFFVLSSRFKKIGIVPGAESHNGKPCDAMITYLTRDKVQETLWRK